MSNALRLLTFAILSFAAGSQSAWASDYPTRAVRWIVPYPPAGTTDVLARIMAQRLSETLGQPVVVENKLGAGNHIGAELVINAYLYKNLSYNFIRDIALVAGPVRTPKLMVATNNLPVKTVAAETAK
jgi:tripartite-type tricarboxylate transporter receptor subunit TctC